MARPLRVLHIASECAPFVKTGGLGDVVGALPIAQRERGLDARVVVPLYRGIDWDALERLPHTLIVPMGGFTAYGSARRGWLGGEGGAPAYFLEHLNYYDRGGLYGDAQGDFGDNVERFAYLCRGAFALARAEGFSPDIVHAHDWQAALAPAYVKTTEWGTPLHGAGSVLTVHNLGYQGVFAPDGFGASGLGPEYLRGDQFEHFGTLNLLKGGLVYADRVVAVSPTYAREIAHPDKGNGLDGVIRARAGAVTGVLNGIDDRTWNPRTDRHLAAHFHAGDLSGKAACKAALQREAGLPERPDVPMYGVVTRLTGQKGMDMLLSVLPAVLRWDVQLVVLGSGDPSLEAAFEGFARTRPDKVAAFLRFDDALAHRIEAGSDFFVMPSRYEPCGMNQMYSLRYGTLPIVHATGGLADTVWNYDERTGSGTGFVVQELTPRSLYDVLGWSLWAFHNRRDDLDRMRRFAMSQDFGWSRAAAAYEDVYRAAYAARRGHPFDAGESSPASTRGPASTRRPHQGSHQNHQPSQAHSPHQPPPDREP
ncbi:MAG: glycogen synthase GlgA [Polyangiaceae bacterium]|nr:glycogen synthase GlgA [Polyangiaceae bacterium]